MSQMSACAPLASRIQAIVPSGKPTYSGASSRTAMDAYVPGPGVVDASVIRPDAIVTPISSATIKSRCTASAGSCAETSTQKATAASATNAGDTDAPSGRASSASSTPAAAAATAASTSVAHGGSHSNVAPTRTMSTAALTRREIDTLSSALCRAHRLGMNGAVTAVAFLVVDDGFEEMPGAEVRPERVGHPDFRVGNLPQQEITDTHFAAGADQKIGIGLPGGVEERGEGGLVERLRIDAGADRTPRSIHDFRPPAITERDVELHAGVGGRARLGARELLANVGTQPIGLADHAELDVVLEKRFQLGPEIVLEQA